MHIKFHFLPWLLALSFLSPISPIRADSLARPLETTMNGPATASAATVPAQKLNFREKIALRIIRYQWKKHRPDMEQACPNGSAGDTINNYNTASMAFGIVGNALRTLAGLTIGTWSGAWILLIVAVIALIAGLSLGTTGLKKKHPKRGQGIAGVILSGGGLAELLLTVLGALILIYALGG